MSQGFRFWKRLQQLGLVVGEADESLSWPWSQADHRALLILADAQALQGGVSLALNVRPDECIGVLSQRMGVGKLKVLDVRDSPELILDVLVAGSEEQWTVPDVRALVDRLNASFRASPSVRFCAVLGEWKDALHVWFGARLQLQTLLLEPWFQPVNRPQLLAYLDSTWSP